jgi:hypothetical protein
MKNIIAKECVVNETAFTVQYLNITHNAAKDTEANILIFDAVACSWQTEYSLFQVDVCH